MDRDELLTLERRYNVRLNSNNQREAYQLASAATLDIPRLVAAVQQALAERDNALAELAAARGELAQVRSAVAIAPLTDTSPMSKRWWSARSWRRKPQVPAA